MVTLYTIGCTKCVLLEKKLLEVGVDYKVCEDRDVMEQKGFDFMPVLEVDGQIMNFGEAIKWANERS